ncbi:hypothetical protein [Microbacterium sp. H1-D42]|uniref:hypothetical protein n=1 Tax=Microbacterium sp. H1-D42 TaxID=2925844 RepID=UPI001F52CD69|nr:hypothetical protein [Microbacterium sp. H1-D42]UNK70328.1 hypothetical protein MNR00_14355 [Microbacterium sp. H1-D42]
MLNTRFTARLGAVGAGALLLAGVASAAVAEEGHGNDDVSVNVEIADNGEPGVLAMTVAADSMTLTENGSTATERQFTGTLPTVTVTDTRSPGEIADGAYWYVLGTSSDFAGDAGQPVIDAGHLGWAPNLIDGGASGLVSEGDVVDTVMDSDDPESALPFGLVDQELLAMAFDSGEVLTEGQWTADAELFLRTPADVAAGAYSATLTLSLFE